MVSHEKKATCSTQNLKNLTHGLVTDSCHALMCIRSDLCTLPISSNGMLKTTSTQRSKFNEINNFQCFIKGILNRNWCFYYYECMEVKNMTTDTLQCHCLDSYWNSKSFTQPSVQKSAQWRKILFMKIVLTWWIPEVGSETSRGLRSCLENHWTILNYFFCSLTYMIQMLTILIQIIHRNE